VVLPGFQKGMDIKASYGKGQGAVFDQKRAICVVQGKPWKTDRISTPFWVNKMFSLKF
jgi:hypothetical protein